MGSGKTTIGNLLAEQLSSAMTDLDQEIVAHQGQTIPEIFAHGGEASFRRIEHETLQQVLATKNGILATGGGTPLRDDNRQMLKQDSAPVILLEASPDETARRIQNDSNRPLANKLDATGLGRLLAERQTSYQDCADFSIATDHLTPQEVVQKVLRVLAK